MTDLSPNDLSHLSDEEFNALCPQGEHAPGPEPLSSVAQAIFFAADGMQPRQYRGRALGAALRALADQVVPTKPNPVTCPGDNKEEFIARYNVWINMHLTRNKILAIATELEGQ